MTVKIATFKKQVLEITGILTNDAEKRKIVRQGDFSKYNASHRLIMPSSPEESLRYNHLRKCWGDKPSSTTIKYRFTSDHLECAKNMLAPYNHPITLTHDNNSFSVEIYFNKTQLNLNNMKKFLKAFHQHHKKKEINIEHDWTKKAIPLPCVSIQKKETPYNIFGVMRDEDVCLMCIRSDIIKPPNWLFTKSTKRIEYTEQLIKSFSTNFDIIAPLIESAINRT